MSDDGPSREDLQAELDRTRAELAQLRRHLEQITRVAKASEALAQRSKRAMLRTHSELQQKVAELGAAKALAEEAALAKGRFLATMSHELRTPLNGMVGSAELLQATRLDAEQESLVALLHRSSTSLLAIVNDILDYSRIEAGRVCLEDIAFGLHDCVGDVVELQRQVALERGLELTLEVAPSLPAFVRGDPGRLRQVLMNLVSNAIKFTPCGQVDVRVLPASGQRDDLVQFVVQDTGIGIAPVAQDRLFQAFVQADASTTRRFGGTGLGLVISRHLVELMGGAIEFESEPGGGTTFRFTCALAAAAAAEPAATPTSRGPDAESAARPRTGTRGRVLVVDDNPGNRMVVRKMLARLGCAAEEVQDGAAAIAAVGTTSFDLVLMDCSMPVMDGYEATRAIRAMPQRSRVPVVALTAYAMPEDEARCRAAGMDDYLAKPLRMQQLTTVLDRFLGARA
ncbi:MAG: ATP-binding protein [Planctomycetota bacterium]